jgi:hypothetical protein
MEYRRVQGVQRRMRMERVLVICEVGTFAMALQLIVIKRDCKRRC